MRLGARPALSLVLLSLFWGYSWIWNKLALLDAGPFTFSAYRMLLAATSLLLVLPLTRRSVRPTGVRDLLVLGLVQTTGFVGLSMWALVEGGVGSTSILVFTMPFWTLLLAWPFLGERELPFALVWSRHSLHPMRYQPLNSTSSYRNIALLLFLDYLYGTWVFTDTNRKKRLHMM